MVNRLPTTDYDGKTFRSSVEPLVSAKKRHRLPDSLRPLPHLLHIGRPGRFSTAVLLWLFFFAIGIHIVSGAACKRAEKKPLETTQNAKGIPKKPGVHLTFPQTPKRSASSTVPPLTTGSAHDAIVAILDENVPYDRATNIARQAASRFGNAHRDIARAANTRSYRLFKAGATQAALTLAEAAADIDTSYGMPRYNAARIHVQNHNIEGWIRYLAELKALGPAQRSRLLSTRKDLAFKRVWQSRVYRSLLLRHTQVLSTRTTQASPVLNATIPKTGQLTCLFWAGACQGLEVRFDSATAAASLTLSPPETGSDLNASPIYTLQGKPPLNDHRVLPAEGTYLLVVKAPPGTSFSLRISTSGQPGKTYNVVSRPMAGDGDLAICDKFIAFSARGVFRYKVLKEYTRPCQFQERTVCRNKAVLLSPAGVDAPWDAKSLVLEAYDNGYWISFCDDENATQRAAQGFYQSK